MAGPPHYENLQCGYNYSWCGYFVILTEIDSVIRFSFLRSIKKLLTKHLNNLNSFIKIDINIILPPLPSLFQSQNVYTDYEMIWTVIRMWPKLHFDGLLT